MNVPHIRILHDQWAVFIAPVWPHWPTRWPQQLKPILASQSFLYTPIHPNKKNGAGKKMSHGPQVFSLLFSPCSFVLFYSFIYCEQYINLLFTVGVALHVIFHCPLIFSRLASLCPESRIQIRKQMQTERAAQGTPSPPLVITPHPLFVCSMPE